LTNHLLPAFHDQRLSEIDYEANKAYRTARLREGARRKRATEACAPLRDRRGRRLRPFGPRQVNASIRLLAQILDRGVRSDLFALAHHPARDRDLKVKREKPACQTRPQQRPPSDRDQPRLLDVMKGQGRGTSANP
jgi:hypothetical protein